MPTPARSPARIVVDCANGATTGDRAGCSRAWFRRESIGVTPNGRNINLDCGSTHLEGCSRGRRDEAARLGVAFDGDGDRALFVDTRGRIVDGDAILLMARDHLQGARPAARQRRRRDGDEQHRPRDRAARSRHRAGAHAGRRQVRDGGDGQARLALGGEQSGHIIFADHLFTGDGMATALNVLRIMADTGKELDELAASLVTYPQVLVNVRVREKPTTCSAGDRRHVKKVEAAPGRARAGCWSATPAPSRCCESCSKGRTTRRSAAGRTRSPTSS